MENSPRKKINKIKQLLSYLALTRAHQPHQLKGWLVELSEQAVRAG